MTFTIPKDATSYWECVHQFIATVIATDFEVKGGTMNFRVGRVLKAKHKPRKLSVTKGTFAVTGKAATLSKKKRGYKVKLEKATFKVE